MKRPENQKQNKKQKAYSEDIGQHCCAAIVVCILEVEITQFALCLAFLFVWLSLLIWFLIVCSTKCTGSNC